MGTLGGLASKILDMCGVRLMEDVWKRIQYHGMDVLFAKLFENPEAPLHFFFESRSAGKLLGWADRPADSLWTHDKLQV